MKNKIFCKLTENIAEASTKESKEILDTIEILTCDDPEISMVKHFSIKEDKSKLFLVR